MSNSLGWDGAYSLGFGNGAGTGEQVASGWVEGSPLGLLIRLVPGLCRREH